MLTLYNALENQVISEKTSCIEKAKCAVAANIAIEILKLESEGIRAVKEGLVAVAAEKKNALKGKNNVLDNLNNRQSKNRYDDDKSINEYDPNRKF